VARHRAAALAVRESGSVAVAAECSDGLPDHGDHARSICLGQDTLVGQVGVACNESGSAQRVTSGSKVGTAARGRQITRPRSLKFERMLSWQLDAALFQEENAGGWFERWLARSLRRRLAARLPGWVR